ncbi:hypothetical protein Tco_0421637 [Tanacetum coccineum]
MASIYGPCLNSFMIMSIDIPKIDINYAAGGNLRRLSVEEAWETIEDCAQCDKQWKNPTSTILDQTIANLKAHLVENEVVRVMIPKCMSWLDSYDEHIDTTSVIDHYLGGMVLEKPFVKESRLVYEKDEGTVVFEKDNEKITFKMPHKMERFKHIDIEDLKTDNLPPFIIANDDSGQEKTYYLDSLNLGPEYKQDESVTKSIQCLNKMKSRTSEGGVT